MAFQRGDTLLFTGDSVTDCGRSREGFSAPGSTEGMGSGYAMFAKAYLDAFYPELSLKIVNKGISGNRTGDILARMEEDHLALKPDIVTVLIGINDVWRHFDSPDIVQTGPEEYRANLQKILAGFKTSARKVFVLPPFLIRHDDGGGMYKMAREYEAIAKSAAAQAGAEIVDLWSAFDGLIEKADPAVYSGDSVHPSAAGHMVIAQRLLKALLK